MGTATSVSSSKPQASEAAKHAFLYLTSFATLGLTAIALGTLLFQIINYLHPDESYAWYAFSQSPLKFAIATIFVTAPIYYFVTRLINRSIAKKDLDTDSGVRKWLTYIVLFFAIGTVIGDLITLIVYFLDGELTVRFALKVLTILVIAGGIFLYYLTDIKNPDEKSRLHKNNMWGVFFWIFVLVPFVGAFFLMENPLTTRAKRIDDNTVVALQGVRYGIEGYFAQEQHLPQSIEEINTPQYSAGANLEELQQHNFRYEPSLENAYRLCADFERDNRQDSENSMAYDAYYASDTNWEHPAGNFCFELKVPTSPEPTMMKPGMAPGMPETSESVLAPIDAN